MKWNGKKELENLLIIENIEKGTTSTIHDYLDPYTYSRLLAWFYQKTLYNPSCPGVKDPFINNSLLISDRKKLSNIINLPKLLESGYNEILKIYCFRYSVYSGIRFSMCLYYNCYRIPLQFIIDRFGWRL